jgi:serine protease Do
MLQKFNWPAQVPGKTTSKLLAALLMGSSLGMGATILASGPSHAANPPPITVNPSNPQSGFASLVTRVKPAVVQISTISGGATAKGEGAEQLEQSPDVPDLQGPFGDMLRRYFGQQGRGLRMPEQRAQGSGFIIDPDGYIVTNNHVVDGARQVSVTLTDGDKYTAKVIGRDEKTDLALVKIQAGHPLPYVAFGDSDSAHEGDWVVAVGNPYGLGGTVTAGIISAHGRNINAGPYDDFLQIDAPINPGNSGGPLFNQSGQVVGIDTAIYSPSGGSVGIGFAIPSNVAKTIVAQLRDHGKVTRGWLGVAMQPLTPSLAKAVGLANNHGVLVDTVTPGSPAAKADLRQGDVITAFDGKPIEDARSLAMAVAETAAGKTVPVAIWRENRSRTVDVTIRTQDETQVASNDAGSGGGARVGMTLQPLTPDLRSQLNLPTAANGVLVGDVAEGSKAEDSGVQAGDLIERVGGNPVSTPAQVSEAIRAAQQQKKQAVALLVRRNGVSAYLGLQLADS